MRPHHEQLFELLRSEQPDLAPVMPAPMCVAMLIRDWLAAGPVVFQGMQRQHLSTLCRQIDVRKRISVAYGEDWQTLVPEQPAAPIVVSGLVAVLLANASATGAHQTGWSLKCVNSALKAIDLCVEAPHRPALQAWAWEILDRAASSGPPS